MSVEHTSQLLQLILNSVMMMVCCGFVLGRLSLRCAAIDEQISSLRRTFLESDLVRGDGQPSPLSGNRWLHAKKQFRQIQRCRRVLSYGSLAIHYALLLAIGSTLLLATRTLINLEFLIPLSLGLFTAAAAALLAGVAGALLELHLSNRSLSQELETLMELDAPVDLSRLTPARSRRAANRARSSHARVG